MLDKKIIKQHHYIHRHIPLLLPNVPRKKIFSYPRFCWLLLITTAQIFWQLKKNRPDKVISFGGYISVPVCLIAYLLRIPIELYELNVIPGLAIKLLSRFAQKTYICFSQTKEFLPNKPLEFISYPIRFSVEQQYDKNNMCSQLGISPTNNIIFVLGGSQGSHFINKLMQDFIEQTSPVNTTIIHQTGERDIQALTQFYAARNQEALVFSYRSDIELCYNAADFIIARAGAGTLFEILHFNKRALIIPLETNTTDHQLHNAHAMAKSYPKLFTTLRQCEIAHNPKVIATYIK